MKTLLLLLFLAIAPALKAQEPARDIDSVLVDQRIKRYSAALTLTDEQKTKLRPLVLDEIKAFKGYRADSKLTEADRVEKEKAFRAAARPKFKAILSEEQFVKYEQLQSEKKGKKPAK